MPGSRITRKQEEMYMKSRQTGLSQEVAAARSGLSVRSGRRIEKGKRAPVPHTWRTRQDPLVAVWESHLVRLTLSPFLIHEPFRKINHIRTTQPAPVVADIHQG